MLQVHRLIFHKADLLQACFESLSSAGPTNPASRISSNPRLSRKLKCAEATNLWSPTEVPGPQREIARSEHEHQLHTISLNPLKSNLNLHPPSWARRTGARPWWLRLRAFGGLLGAGRLSLGPALRTIRTRRAMRHPTPVKDSCTATTGGAASGRVSTRADAPRPNLRDRSGGSPKGRPTASPEARGNWPTTWRRPR